MSIEDPRDSSFPEPLQHVEHDWYKYRHGGLEVKATNILRLISELEGSYQLCKYMAFDEDMKTLEEIKTKYYKMYFRLSKQEKSILE